MEKVFKAGGVTVCFLNLLTILMKEPQNRSAREIIYLSLSPIFTLFRHLFVLRQLLRKTCLVAAK